MAYQPFKKRTDAEQWDIDRPRIHALKNKVISGGSGFDDDNYRDIILDISHGKFGSSKDLSAPQRQALITRLSDLAPSTLLRGRPPVAEQGQTPVAERSRSYPHRPKNMDKPGESRAEQLGKIEALLTIGKLPWSYADSIAKQMRLADKVQWVESGNLYKIITALRKKAQKEGWDLSGEKK